MKEWWLAFQIKVELIFGLIIDFVKGIFRKN